MLNGQIDRLNINGNCYFHWNLEIVYTWLKSQIKSNNMTAIEIINENHGTYTRSQATWKTENR